MIEPFYNSDEIGTWIDESGRDLFVGPFSALVACPCGCGAIRAILNMTNDKAADLLADIIADQLMESVMVMAKRFGRHGAN